MKKLQNIKAVGFDVDRTIFHSPVEWSLMIGKVVTDWAADQLGRDRDDFAAEYLVRRDTYASNTLTLRSYGLEPEKIFQEVFDQYPVDPYVTKDVRLIALMKELKKRYQLFIITNGTERQVTKKLRLLGLTPSDFDPFICAFDHGWAKPEPAPFLAALEALGVSAAETVYVGDREDVDVEGAKAVGMKAIMVGGESALADHSCDAVYDIASLL